MKSAAHTPQSLLSWDATCLTEMVCVSIWEFTLSLRCASRVESGPGVCLKADHQANLKMAAVERFGSGRFGSSTLNLSGTVVQPS